MDFLCASATGVRSSERRLFRSLLDLPKLSICADLVSAAVGGEVHGLGWLSYPQLGRERGEPGSQ